MTTPMDMIRFLIPVFCLATMFAMGLDLTQADVLAPFRNWLGLVIIILVNNVLVPLLGFVILALPAALAGILPDLVKQLVPLNSGQQIGFLLVILASGSFLGPLLASLAGAKLPFAKGVMLILVVASALLVPFELGLLCGFQGMKCSALTSGSVFMALLLYQMLPLALGVVIKVRYDALAVQLRPLIVQLTSLTFLILLILLVTSGQLGSAVSATMPLVRENLFTSTVLTDVTTLDGKPVPTALATEFAQNGEKLPQPSAVGLKTSTGLMIVDPATSYIVASGTSTNTATATNTATSTNTATPTNPATATATAINTVTPTATNTITPTAIATNTPRPEGTRTPTTTATATSAATQPLTRTLVISNVSGTPTYTLSFNATAFKDVVQALDSRQITSTLRTELNKNEINQSANSVAVITKNSKWALFDETQTYFIESKDGKFNVYREISLPSGLIAQFLKSVASLPVIGPLASFLLQLITIAIPYLLFAALAVLLMLIGYYGGVAVRNVVGATGADIPRTLSIAGAVRNVSAALIVANSLPATPSGANSPAASAIAVVLTFYTVSLVVAAIQANKWAGQPDTAPVAPASQPQAAVMVAERGATSTP